MSLNHSLRIVVLLQPHFQQVSFNKLFLLPLPTPWKHHITSNNSTVVLGDFITVLCLYSRSDLLVEYLIYPSGHFPQESLNVSNLRLILIIIYPY